MATFTFFQDFKEQLAKGNHNFGTDTIKVRLTNSAPNAATWTALSDVTAITGGSYADQTSTITVTESGGTATIGGTGSDVTFTASGSDFTQCQYAVWYNDSMTTPVTKGLIGYVATGAVTVANGNSLALDVGANGIATLA